MGINGRVLFFSTVLRLSIMNKNSKYANSTWTKRLCHANLYPGSGGCRMWQGERAARGRGYSHPTHTSGVQKSAIGNHLKATLPTSVLNGRVHKSYCKISELQRCFYCCTYRVCIYMLRYRFLISRLFAFCSSEFSGVSQFTFSHTATAAPPSCFNWNVHWILF